MLHHSDGAMLLRLLRLLVFCSLGSAVMGQYTDEYSDEDDPTTTVQPTASVEQGNDWSMRRSFHMNEQFPPGTPDMAICDILMNSAVPAPVDQIPLYCFCSHCKGTVGPKGDQGDRGHPGFPGSPGRRGMTGFKGRRGFTGTPGIKGQKGDLGEKGHIGTAGFTGMKGGRGFKGDKGDRGLIGPAGVEGPQGVTGTCPATCGNTQGPPGPKGPSGPAGGHGLPGVQGKTGPRGFMGDKGDLGRTGEPGKTGHKGDDGEKGECDCKDGEDGTDGTPGRQGSTGDKGDTGKSGVKGDMGLSGDKGDMGLYGLPGPCTPAIQSAFSACITTSYPLPNLPVPFPHVLTNQQGHFNPQRGIYTSPFNGTYVFSFHLAVANKVLKVGLFHDFNAMVINTEMTDHGTTSQTVVLHLLMGDRVWLQVKDSTSNGMYKDRESSSTFSGYLLYPDTCDIPDMPVGRGFGPMNDINEESGDYEWDVNTTPSP